MDFSEVIFPYTFDCMCGAVQMVSKRDAVDLAPHARTVGEAAEIALRERYGWMQIHRQPVCPSCLRERGDKA